LLDQLRKYANGQRTVHPRDAGGVMMKAALAGLSPDDLRSVVAYIARDLTVTPPLQKVQVHVVASDRRAGGGHERRHFSR